MATYDQVQAEEQRAHTMVAVNRARVLGMLLMVLPDDEARTLMAHGPGPHSSTVADDARLVTLALDTAERLAAQPICGISTMAEVRLTTAAQVLEKFAAEYWAQRALLEAFFVGTDARASASGALAGVPRG